MKIVLNKCQANKYYKYIFYRVFFKHQYLAKIRHILILNLFFVTNICIAQINFGFYGGIGRGYIDSSKQAQIVPLGFTFSLEKVIFGGTFSLNFASDLQHGRVVYLNGGVTYAGILNTADAGIDLLWNFTNYKFSIGGRGIGYGAMTTKSQQVSRVNDYIIQNSSFYSYTNPTGGSINLILQKQNKINQLGKDLKMFFGVTIQAFALNFSTHTLSVTTNDQITGANYNKKIVDSTSLIFATISTIVSFNF